MNERVPLRFDANLKWLFTEVPFLDRFKAAADAGFRAVEYAAPYPYPVPELRSRLDDLGLTQVLINTPVGEPGSIGRSGFACLPDHVPEFREGVELALEYATELGAAYVHIVGGIRPPPVSWDRAFARYVANIGWAAERAEGSGVRLLLEAQNKRDAPEFVLAGPHQAAAVAEAVGGDSVGVLFDFYHAHIDQGDVIETYRQLRGSVSHVQVADPPARHEPGTGEIAWRRVFAELRESGYAGWIGCEYQPLGDTAAGLGWIAELSS
jgi:hydroxypyruvate isomerase